MNSTDNKEKDLFYLHELSDYKVDSDYPDVRGWDMQDVDGKSIGTIDGLLVSKKEERVVYLDIKVAQSVIEAGYETYGQSAGSGVHGFMNADGKEHLIVPIGMADIDEDNKVVWSNEINHSTFAKTERFDKGTGFSRDYETSVYTVYRPSAGQDTLLPEDDFYRRDDYGFKTEGKALK